MHSHYYFNPSLLKPLLLISCVAGSLLIMALLSKKENKTAHRILAIVICLSIFFQMTSSYQLLKRLNFPFSLLNSSLLYLYIFALTHRDFVFQNKKRHLIPFAFGLCWYFLFMFLDIDEKYFRNIATIFIFGFYLKLSYRCITQYKADACHYFSESIKVRLNWLKTILFLASLFWVLAVADLASGPNIPLWQFRPFITTFSLFVLTLFALTQSRVFAVIEDPTTKTPRLSDEELNRYRKELLEYMEIESPYLNPELRLTDLSESLGLKSYQLSEVLNRGMGTNFFQFINRYRIEVAKKRLSDPQYNYMNIVGIAMDSGFNSKSSFNETFREFVGLTPSLYRSKQK